MEYLTDFNDLWVTRGERAVRDQVEAAIAAANDAASQPVPRTPSPEALPETAPYPMEEPSGPGDEAEGGFRYSLSELSRSFALIYGTDEIWDGVNRRIVKASDLREAVGRDTYKEWAVERDIIAGVVFEPRHNLGRMYRNLFEGFPVVPAAGSLNELAAGCARILGHVWFLVGGEEIPFGDDGKPLPGHEWRYAQKQEEYNWLLRWIALPFQRPGAKLASSVVMHGAEGTGKSLLWTIVKRLYGDYSITIGQEQLESQFTSWKSRKLFALCEEVVSRAEKAHYKGKLKHVVTGDTHVINEKMMREREEPNLMNFVFLSNEMQPLQLDFGDRRYYVRTIHQVKPEAYFQALRAEVDDGGLEAFLGLLLALPMDGFHEHTKPPANEDKEALIQLSLSSPAAFHQAWQAGDVDALPYQPCTVADLYRLYQCWCRESNEHCKSERVFGGELKRFMEQVRHDIRYPSREAERRTMRVWVPRGWPIPEGVRPVEAIETACLTFFGAMTGASYSAQQERPA